MSLRGESLIRLLSKIREFYVGTQSRCSHEKILAERFALCYIFVIIYSRRVKIAR